MRAGSIPYQRERGHAGWFYPLSAGEGTCAAGSIPSPAGGRGLG